MRQWLSSLLHASAVRLDRLGPPYPVLPPPRRKGTVLVAPLKYGKLQLAQMFEQSWYHPERSKLAAHRPTRFTAYERAEKTQTARITWLWQIVDWKLVDGRDIDSRAQFGDRLAGSGSCYWLINLAKPVRLEPEIKGYDREPRGPMFVPLEVFDLAESVFLLRGNPRHAELLRVLHYL